MALLVSQAYEQQAIAAIEAGTGIGKSFAYLVPALMQALENPEERTVIATATINLQKQLFEKDIPQLFKALGVSCPVALVVGRGNYLCINRLEEYLENYRLMAMDPNSEVGMLSHWSHETQTGLKADLPFNLPANIWGEINCDPDFCSMGKCPYFSDCFLMKSRRKASAAKIIVTNHHMMFTDARKRLDDDVPFTEESILPAYQHLVIDEAHNIEKNATEYFTGVYSGEELHRQLWFLNHKRGGRSKSLLEELAPYNIEPGLVDTILDQINLLEQQIVALEQYLISWLNGLKVKSLWVKVEQQSLLKDFIPLAHNVAATASRLNASCIRLIEHNNAPEELDNRMHELQVHAHRVQLAADVLNDFQDFSKWGDDVHWINVETKGRNKEVHASVLISPLSIAEQLRLAIYEKLSTVVCTSATLTLGDDFGYWTSRVGLPPAGKRKFIKGTFESPFDYEHRLMLLTPVDAPEYLRAKQQEFVDYAAATVSKSVQSAGGGSLVLFTSYEMLKTVRNLIGPELQKLGYTVLSQDNGERTWLLDRFKNERDSILFATDSFWEGVDAPGDTLRLVIIVKLPFRVPDDPVFKARQELLEKENKSGFFFLALPEATMKLKQGFGRLMRSTIDYGVVMILDSRVVNKGYGMFMLNALPPSYHPETETGTMSDKIESFLFARH